MEKQVKIVGIIPARFASARFPGKPLAKIKGKPMVQWVYEGCTNIFDQLIVATDDEQIAECVKGFGGKSMITLSTHRTGTERCAEVMHRLEAEAGFTADIVVNIQGDEPLVKTEQLRELTKLIISKNADIATLAYEEQNPEIIKDPNNVKVVRDMNDIALYFSRIPIPFKNKESANTSAPHLIHLGLYAYRSDILKAIVKLPPSPLEKSESLEQLRWIENGYNIAVGIADERSIGVDTPADLKLVERML